MLKKSQIKTHLVTVTDNGTDHIDTSARGICQVEESGLMLRYPEDDNEGYAMLLIAGELVDLKRHGQTESRMTFIEGRLLPMNYVTPRGSFDFSVYTHSQTCEVNALGGTLRLQYSLLQSGRQVADNELTVSWTFE